jgi:Phytanoyl-CoA dioxygenase (PhyH)
MELSLRYTTVRTRLRNYLGTRERMLDGFRLLRCALLQGPWQPWLIHYYRTQHAAPMPVNADTVFPSLDPAGAARALDVDSYAPGLDVPAAMVDDMVAFARRSGKKRIDDPHRDCLSVERLMHDPKIVDVARRFLGAEPIFLKSQIYWTIPDGTAEGNALAAAEGGRFHYDLADIKAVTIFVYLSDVDERCGPHVVIRGSHKRHTPRQILRRFIDDDYARRTYGDRIHTVTGPRGTGWFEDITCYHKQSPAEQPRCMLYLIYALHRRPEGGVARRGRRVA